MLPFLIFTFIVVVLSLVFVFSQMNSLQEKVDELRLTQKNHADRIEKLRKRLLEMETPTKIEPIADTLPKIEPVETEPVPFVPQPVCRAVIPQPFKDIGAKQPVEVSPEKQEPTDTLPPLVEPLSEPLSQPPFVPVESEPFVTAQIVEEQTEPEKPKTNPASVFSSPPYQKTKKRPEPKEAISWTNLEFLIGRKVMLWAAMVIFVVVSALFIKYAVDNQWITNEMKVTGIGLFGLLFVVGGKYFSRTGLRRLSVAMTSTGICIIFMAGYASYGYFNLIPLRYASVMMTLIVVGGFLLSWHYLSRLIGVISVFSGLAVPILVRSGIDQYPEFFTYLVILNLATLVLINLMRRSPMAFVAFFGTQIEFLLWYQNYYIPGKLAAVLTFQASLYLLYLLDTTIASMRPRQRANWDDATRAILSPLIFGGVVWYFLRDHEFYKDWLGIFSFAFAGLYAILAVLYTRHLRRLWDPKLDSEYSQYWKAGPVAAIVMSFVFVATGIPLQLGGEWIAIGWYAVACGLWVAAHSLKNRTFYVLSYIFHALGIGRFLLFNLPWDWDHGVYSATLLHANFLPIVIIGSILIAAAVLTNRSLPAFTDDDKTLNGGFALEGVLILWGILSLKCLDYFSTHVVTLWPSDEMTIKFMSHASLAVLWTLLSSVILLVGIFAGSRWVRIMGFAGFVLVTVKVFLGQLFFRPDFSRIDIDTIAWNPWLVTILIPVVVMIAFALWQIRIRKNIAPDEKKTYLTFSVFSLLIFWIMISLECFPWVKIYAATTDYFTSVKSPALLVAMGSLSILWSVFGAILLLLGIGFRSMLLRVCGVIVFAATSVKIYLFEIATRPDYDTFFANPYFVTILVPALLVMIFAVWATRLSRGIEHNEEKHGFLLLGLNGLLLFWIVGSVEWYSLLDKITTTLLARNLLCLFWTVLAILHIIIGLIFRSQLLRLCGVCGFAASSVVIYGFQVRDLNVFSIFLPGMTSNFYLDLMAGFLPIALTLLAMGFFAIWLTRIRPLKDEEERYTFLLVGLNALVMLWIVLTMDCIRYFDQMENVDKFLRSGSLSVLWGILSLILFAASFQWRSNVLRLFSYLGILLMLGKILSLELFQRPDTFTSPLWNAYFMTILVAAVITMGIGIWGVRVRPVANPVERHFLTGLGILGILLLWGAMSFECFGYFNLQIDWSNHRYIAHVSLSIFWTALALLLVLIGLKIDSPALRYTAFGLLLITFFKIIPYELVERPNDLYPFLNPFAFSMLFLSATIIAASVMTLNALPKQRITERHLVRIFGFGGLGLLWLSSSLECHASFLTLQGDDAERARQAQMALSILWSLFGGILIAIGFLWRSMVLRWISLGLFGLTMMKVVAVDLMGLDSLYRIIALFVFAVVLFLSTLAYQKFKPDKKPNTDT